MQKDEQKQTVCTSNRCYKTFGFLIEENPAHEKIINF